MPHLTPSLDEASAKVDEISGKMHNLLANKDNHIELNTEKLDAASSKFDEISRNLSAKKLKTDVEVGGIDKLDGITEKAQGIADSVGKLFSTLKDQITTIITESSTKVGELSTGINTALDSLITTAASAGYKFVDAFASGIIANPAAVIAATTMAANIKKLFHQSPPKTGPLAAHGDAALYGGKMFVKSYAEGLRTAAPNAAAAARVCRWGCCRWYGRRWRRCWVCCGTIFRGISCTDQFLPHKWYVFTKVSDTVFRLAKFMSDPLGKGTFFGKIMGSVKPLPMQNCKEKE